MNFVKSRRRVWPDRVRRAPYHVIETMVIRIGSAATRQLGRIWVAASDFGLVALEFGVSQRTFVATVRMNGGMRIEDGQRTLRTMTRQVVDYLNGRRRQFAIPIDWSTIPSEFHRAVLKAVQRIPYGETRTYGQIALEVGAPGAARAVGRANATNPIPLVIPCHRLVGADGDLRGYGGVGGVRTKAWLLHLEAIHAGTSRPATESVPRNHVP